MCDHSFSVGSTYICRLTADRDEHFNMTVIRNGGGIVTSIRQIPFTDEKEALSMIRAALPQSLVKKADYMAKEAISFYETNRNGNKGRRKMRKPTGKDHAGCRHRGGIHF